MAERKTDQRAGAQQIGGIDERDAGGDVNPGDVAELQPEHAPVEMDAAAIGVNDEGQDEQDGEPDDGLAAFHGAGLLSGNRASGRWR